MREMRDCLYPLKMYENPPDPTTLIAAYVDNSDNPLSYNQAVSAYPKNQIVSISTEARFFAQILDVERGATDPANKSAIVDWINRARYVGGDPIIYATPTNWVMVASYFGNNPPQWWEANWNGEQTITPGSMGHQYANSDSAVPVGAYDSSVILDYVKGIDMSLPYNGITQADVVNIYETPPPVGTDLAADNGSTFQISLAAGLAPVLAAIAKLTPAPAQEFPTSGTFTFDPATGTFTFTPEKVS